MQESTSSSQPPKTIDIDTLHSCMLRLAPSEYSPHESFRCHINNLFRQYKELLSLVRPEDRFEGWDKSVEKVHLYCNKIEETLKLYNQGLHSQAFHTLSEILPDLSLANLHNSDQTTYYRMRTVEAGTKPTLEGMFHIPFNQRHNVKTQRYSTPGLPSLYLSKTIYCCWKELGEPDMSTTYVSRFQPTGRFSYLNLLLPILDIWKKHHPVNYVFRYNIESFPFVMASMVRTLNPNAPFKPEYIIPQLILQWVVENRTPDDDPSQKPIGVMYSSVFYDREYNDPIPAYINAVIPAFNSGEDLYSKQLTEWFQLSEPSPLSAFDYRKFKAIDMVNVELYLKQQDLKHHSENYPLKQIDVKKLPHSSGQYNS